MLTSNGNGLEIEDNDFLVDTHCHLHDRKFFTEEEAEEMLSRAREDGVEKIICIGTSYEDSLAAREFALNHDGVYWTFGVHPDSAGTEWKFDSTWKNEKLVGIGEVGLDYHHVEDEDGNEIEKPSHEAQMKLFYEMLSLADKEELPVSFHIREAYADFFPAIANFPAVRGVVHCFTDSKKMLRRILEETTLYIGVNGIMTYSTLALPTLSRSVLETDAPFLAPVPHRGDKNEPAYIRDVAEWLAASSGEPFERVKRMTTANAISVYGLPDPVLAEE